MTKRYLAVRSHAWTMWYQFGMNCQCDVVVVNIVIIVADKRRTRVRKWAILIVGAHTSRVTCMAPRRRLQFDLKLWNGNERRTTTPTKNVFLFITCPSPDSKLIFSLKSLFECRAEGEIRRKMNCHCHLLTTATTKQLFVVFSVLHRKSSRRRNRIAHFMRAKVDLHVITTD